MMSSRKLVSAAPPIRGNNQLMVIVGGGGDKRGGQLWGIWWQKRVEVEVILWRNVELHEITSLPNFHKPKSSEKTGTYSACILGVLLCCQRHDQLMVVAQSEGWLAGVLSIFSYFGIFCNFNIIFNHVVGPICRRILHKQPLHHSTRLVETLLLVELVFEICNFHGTTKFWKTLCYLAEFSK